MDTDDRARTSSPATHGAAPERGAPKPPPPAPEAPQPGPVIRYSRVPWKRIGIFMLLSYGLFALIAAPFWFLPDGIAHPAYTWVIALGMWASAIASVILAKGVERTSLRTRVGLRFRGRWLRTLAWARRVRADRGAASPVSTNRG